MSLQKFIWTTFVALISNKALATDVQVVLKALTTEKTQRAVYYTVTAGDIDGQATVTSVTSSRDGQARVNSEIVGVKSTFNNSNAPYGGHITATIECRTQKYVKQKSILFDGNKTPVVMAVASSRRIFGICAADEIKFASGTWAAYDKNESRVLTVKLFKPVTSPAQIDKSQQDILQIFNKVITHL